MRIPSRRTTAHVVGYTALTLILTAGAAQSLSGSNTVFSDDIVDGTITHADVKANSIGGSKLLNNAVTGAKILDNSLLSADIRGDTLVYEAEGESKTVGTNPVDLGAECNLGDVAIGAQWEAAGETTGLNINASVRDADFADTWWITADAPTSRSVTVWAVCIRR